MLGEDPCDGFVIDLGHSSLARTSECDSVDGGELLLELAIREDDEPISLTLKEDCVSFAVSLSLREGCGLPSRSSIGTVERNHCVTCEASDDCMAMVVALDEDRR